MSFKTSLPNAKFIMLIDFLFVCAVSDGETYITRVCQSILLNKVTVEFRFVNHIKLSEL